MRIGIDSAYVIKGKSGKHSLYYDEKEMAWTTLVWCTKFYSKREATKVKNTTQSDWVKNIEVAKCKIKEC